MQKVLHCDLKMRKAHYFVFENLGTVQESLCERIEKEEDFEVLKQWTQLAFQSKSLEEFEEKISL